MRRTTKIAVYLCILVLTMSSGAFAAISPQFHGKLDVALQGGTGQKLSGTANLDLNLIADTSGATRVYFDLGINPGQKALGATQYPWGDWTPRIKTVFLQHHAPLVHGGQDVTFRLGVSPIPLSQNVAKIDQFQGLYISGLKFLGLNANMVYGWNAPTGAFGSDQVAGIKAVTNVLGSDVGFAYLALEEQDVAFWELDVKRSISNRMSLEALFLSDGFVHPYFYTLRTSLGDHTRAALTMYDYGQFNTGRYHSTADSELYHKYSNKHDGYEASITGRALGVNWEFGYNSWDNLLSRQQTSSVNLSTDLGPFHVSYETERNQTTNQTTKGLVSLSTSLNVTRSLQDVKLELKHDSVASTDRTVFSSEYRGPNGVVYRLEQRSDSGLAWSISNEVRF